MAQVFEFLTGAGCAPAYTTLDDTMLMNFLSTMDVRLKWLENQISPGNQAEKDLLAEIKQRIAKLLQPPTGPTTADRAWNEAYGLERMLSLLEPAATLVNEIQRRLDEAASEMVSAEPRLRAAFTEDEKQALDSTKTPPELRPAAVPALRMMLLDVLEEIHWTIQRKFLTRPIQKSATTKIVAVGLFSFLLVLAPYLLIFFLSTYNSQNATTWTGLPLYSALSAGLFGAFFSRLLFMQTYASSMSLGELKNAREFVSIFLRGSVGMCGALIVFFFLQSGIVTGSLMPKFDQTGLSEFFVSSDARLPKDNPNSLHLILPSPNLALLIVWCFLAGFSERLVPSILSTTEGTLGNAAKATKK